MTDKQDFEQRWSIFIDAFSQAFDTEQTRQRVHDVVDQETSPDASYEERLINFTNAYQTLRTDNLIKAVVQNWDHLTKGE